MAPGLPVYLSRPPHSVRLLVWGRASDGWWGLVAWEQRVLRGVEPTTLPVTAWVPAQSLTKPGWSSGDAVPRVRLPAMRHEWPPPEQWQGWFAGAWADGPLRLPPGDEVVSGPQWRDRSRRR